MANFRFLNITDNALKAEGAEDCYEWFKKIKNDHEAVRKESIREEIRSQNK